MGSLRYVVSGGGGAELYVARCGKGGKPCPDDGAKIVRSVHHYLTVEVLDDYVRMCAKQPDGTPLEECQQFDLPNLAK
jgi:hypothetical protein